MITCVSRVARAAVRVHGEVVGAIEHGLLLLVGVERGDGPADADATARKVASLRLFPGRTPTDLAVGEVGGGCLVVSQFTLAAELRHGNRPDFTAAAPPAEAEALYERVAAALAATGLPVATGRFGAAMRIDAEHDGPFTVLLQVREGRVQTRPALPPNGTSAT